jgi:hypothetical protein
VKEAEMQTNHVNPVTTLWFSARNRLFAFIFLLLPVGGCDCDRNNDPGLKLQPSVAAGGILIGSMNYSNHTDRPQYLHGVNVVVRSPEYPYGPIGTQDSHFAKPLQIAPGRETSVTISVAIDVNAPPGEAEVEISQTIHDASKLQNPDHVSRGKVRITSAGQN